jgi:hypothetical protein
MRNTNPQRCPHCDASMNEHPHTLNVGLCKALYYCARKYKKNPFHIKELSTVQYCNFQTLRYWGLIEHHVDEGDRKGGWWKLTATGIGFCQLTLRLPEKLWSYRGKRVKDSWVGERLVLITQVSKGYDYRGDYEHSARGLNGIEYP